MPRFGEELGQDEAGTYRRVGNRDRQPPQRPIGTRVQDEGGKGGSEPEQERQQIQERGAGRRDERLRLAGSGCGRCPGGRRFEPGVELGSG